jgi:hypothetical protein
LAEPKSTVTREPSGSVTPWSSTSRTGRLDAQHLLDRIRDPRRIVDQLLALFRILCEQHGAVADQVHRRVGAADHQVEAEAEQLFARELHAVHSSFEQRTHEVVSRLGPALREQHGELLVDPGRRLLYRMGLRPRLDHRLGALEEAVATLLGNADQLADHDARQCRRKAAKEVALAFLLHLVEQARHRSTDARLEAGDPPRREDAAQNSAHGAVPIAVHEHDHWQQDPRLLDPARCKALRIPQHLHHVVVA